MNKIVPALLLSLAIVAPAAAQPSTTATATTATAAAMQNPVAATRGKMLVDPAGARLGEVFSVAPDGSAQIIIDGRVVTVPASTLSIVSGRLTTSLKKSQVLSLS